MSVDLGGIVITADLELENLISDGRKVEKVLDDLDRTAKSTGSGFDGLNTQMSQVAVAVRDQVSGFNNAKEALQMLLSRVDLSTLSFGKFNTESAESSTKIEKLESKVKLLTTAMSESEAKIKALETELSQLKNAAKGSEQEIGQLKSALEQANTTLQSQGVELGKAQTALTRLAGAAVQGKADISGLVNVVGSLAFAFAPVVGAVAMVGTALLGDFVSGLFESEKKTVDLSGALSDLNKVVQVSQDGTVAMSNEFAEISRKYGELAALMRDKAIEEFSEQVRGANSEISALIGSLDHWTLGFRSAYGSAQDTIDVMKTLNIETYNYSEALKVARENTDEFNRYTEQLSGGVNYVAKELGLSTDEAYGFIAALNELNGNPAPDRVAELSQKLLSLQSSTEQGTAKLRAFQSQLQAIIPVALKVAETLSLVNAEMGESNMRSVAQQEAINRTLKEQQFIVDNLGKSKREIAVARAKEQGMNEKELAEYDALLKKQEDFDNAKKAAAEAERAREAQIKKAKTDAEKAKRKAEQDAKKRAKDVERAAKQAQREQEKAGRKAEQEAKRQAREAEKAQREKERAAQKAAQEAERAAERERQAQQRILDQLDELGERYKIAEMSLQGLNLEIAKYQAVSALGEKATEAQKRQAEELATKIYAVTDAMGNYSSILSQISPTFALDQQYQEQLRQIEELKILYPQAIEDMEQARAKIESRYRKARIDAQWEEWKQASNATAMFGSVVEAMGATASSVLTGILNGTTSLRDAFSAIANTILNSVVQSIVEMGLAQVKQMIMGQAIANSALASSAAQASALSSMWATPAALASLATNGSNAVAAQTGMATTMANAKMLAITGRKNGGVMSARQMYRVGENNQPEIFKASNGMQYMVPGSSGRMFSHSDVRSQKGTGGGMSVVVNQYNTFNQQDGNNADGQQNWASDLMTQIRNVVKEEMLEAKRDGNLYA